MSEKEIEKKKLPEEVRDKPPVAVDEADAPVTGTEEKDPQSDPIYLRSDKAVGMTTEQILAAQQQDIASQHEIIEGQLRLINEKEECIDKLKADLEVVARQYGKLQHQTREETRVLEKTIIKLSIRMP